MTEMTPQEKWRRLTNPQSAADWGIGLTIEEALSVPEAKVEIEKFVPLDVMTEVMKR